MASQSIAFLSPYEYIKAGSDSTRLKSYLAQPASFVLIFFYKAIM